jgi:hypothetical protein
MDHTRIEAENTFLASLEGHVGMTVSRTAALLFGLAYLTCAVSVALHPRSLWDIGTFFILIVAGNFLIVVGLDLRRTFR